MGDVVSIDGRRAAEQVRDDNRFTAIHLHGLKLDELSAADGTGPEWLDAAIGHLKVKSSDAVREDARWITVSYAALSLLIRRQEELEHGVDPWTPGDEA